MLLRSSAEISGPDRGLLVAIPGHVGSNIKIVEFQRWRETQPSIPCFVSEALADAVRWRTEIFGMRLSMFTLEGSCPVSYASSTS